MAALSVCLTRRVQNVRDWTRLPPVCWAVLLIYCDSITFVSGTAILSNGFEVNSSMAMCQRAVLLCLGCYMTTKVLIYFFLVERVYIVRRSSKPRFRDRLYLFNTLGMLIPYCIVIVLNFYFRFAIYENSGCRIGMKRVAMIPLIAFDILVNVYLTSLFLFPLRGLYSYKNNPSSQTRTVTLRTFIGSCATLTSSVVNLTVLMVLIGEPGWICLMCCNVDILFSVLVLHWITAKDNASTLTGSASADFNSPPSPTSKRLVPRPPLYDIPSSYKLSAYDTKKGTQVTTQILALKEGFDGDDIEGIHPFPPNAITVEHNLVREVSGRRSEKSLSDDQKFPGSEEDLFRKC